jgi:hypothetical protein
MNWQRKPFKQLWAILLIALLSFGLSSCSSAPEKPDVVAVSKPKRSKLAEVSPPFAIQSLKPFMEPYQPQVKIVSPRADQVLEDTQVRVQLQVSDLSLYKDEEFELGPYLQVMLDNQPYTQVYDTSEPLILENLSPGTHTLRVFAVQPWHESFKNEGAFAQISFHLFAKTQENQPAADRPLLTYNAPQDTVGAEPVLLDFYLTNVPLHLVAQSDPEDDIPDWQIRCTINSESFTFDRWEPIYLKGLKPGQNWVQLELVDDQGNLIPNAFNSTVQLINYRPGGTDTLSKLTRGELTAEDARKMVDPDYVPPAEPELILEPSPAPTPEPELILEPSPAPTPEPEAETPALEQPQEVVKPEADQPEAEETEAVPEVILEPDLTQEPTPETMPPELVQPAPVESNPVPVQPTEAKSVEPEVEPERGQSTEVPPAQLKPVDLEPLTQPDAVQPAEPAPEKQSEKQIEIQPVETPAVESAESQMLAPESSLRQLDNTVEDLINREPQPNPTPFTLPDSLKIFQEALPERGDIQPMQKLPNQSAPVLAPAASRFAPALLQEAKSVVPEDAELASPAEANLDELKQGLEQLFQPASEQPVPETIPIPQRLQPPTIYQPVSLQSSVDQSSNQLADQTETTSPSETLPDLPDLIDSVLRNVNPEEPSGAEPTPKLIRLFDRVKDFFEGLKKQPSELKLPFLEDPSPSSAGSAPAPETFNQILENLFTPEQPAP